MKISFKVKLVLFIILVLLFISTFKSTYAKYASSATGSATATVANWEILLNNQDINGSGFTSATLTPTLNTNTNVASGKIAPGSTGHIDIVIDITKVDVAFNMGVVLNNTNSSVSDFKVSKVTVYSLNSSGNNLATLKTYTPATPASSYTINASDLLFSLDSSTTVSNTYHKYGTSAAFQKYKIVVDFVWDDTSSGNASDAADTTIGHNAVSNPSTTVGKINATLAFSQYVG